MCLNDMSGAMSMFKDVGKTSKQCLPFSIFVSSPPPSCLTSCVHGVKVEVEIDRLAREGLEVPCAKLNCPHQGMNHGSMFSNVRVFCKLNMYR